MDCRLQKMQIEERLMQNSIIYGPCVMVVWYHEKINDHETKNYSAGNFTHYRHKLFQQ